ncbi:MAG: tetratricopeptide repeat protein [Kofleriaceae bacterium]
MTTLRRLLASTAFACRTAVPVAAALGAVACGGKSKPSVEEPDPDQAKTTDADELAAARKAASAGDVDGADTHYRAAAKRNLQLATVREHVQFLLAHDRARQAVEVAKGYYEAKPADSNGSLVYANALIGAGEYAQAADIAGEVVELDAKNPAGWAARGRAAVGAGRADEGVEDLRHAVELAPKDGQVVRAYGIALETAGKVDEAALQLRAAIELLGEDAEALMHMGIVRMAQVANSEAIGWLNRATKADPNLAEAWFNLAIAQNDMGDNFEAEVSAQKASSLAPDISKYSYVWGEMLRINKKPEAARDAYAKALDAKPPHPKAAVKMATMMAEAGQYADAEVFLTDIINKDPGNTPLYFSLGMVYSAQKKYRLAVEALEHFVDKAQANDPDRGRALAEIKAAKRKIR